MDNAIDVDDNDDLTMEEGINSRELQKRLRACLCRKERREKAWTKQNGLITEQVRYIAEQQAKQVGT